MKTNKIELKEKDANEKAYKKVKKLGEFYSHLRTYFVINTIFFVINLIISPGEWWILYPVIGWGFCLTIHALDVFSPFKDYDDKWQERKTRELIDKYKNT